MDIGIGLPNTVLGVEGRTIPAWARRAEERGFSSLATIGRLVWPGYDELVSFAAAAAVTERIGLLTNVLLAPIYPTAHLAKTTATVDQISAGRLTLGLGVGGRPDDFEAAGVDFSARGARLDQQLAELHDAWAGKAVRGLAEPFGPAAVRGRIPLLIGGSPELAARRAVAWDAGYTVTGAPPEMVAQMVPAFRAAYERHGGRGTPRIVCLTYFSMGDEHTEESLQYLRSYYGAMGDWAEAAAQGAARGEEAVVERARAFEQLGADELIFDPTVNDLRQVDRLAAAVL